MTTKYIDRFWPPHHSYAILKLRIPRTGSISLYEATNENNWLILGGALEKEVPRDEIPVTELGWTDTHARDGAEQAATGWRWPCYRVATTTWPRRFHGHLDQDQVLKTCPGVLRCRGGILIRVSLVCLFGPVLFGSMALNRAHRSSISRFLSPDHGLSRVDLRWTELCACRP